MVVAVVDRQAAAEEAVGKVAARAAAFSPLAVHGGAAGVLGHSRRRGRLGSRAGKRAAAGDRAVQQLRAEDGRSVRASLL